MDQAVIDLAVAAGKTIVNAMAADSWTATRNRIAAWFGRGDADRADQTLELLDDTRTAVDAGRMTQLEAAARWQGRLETVLYDHQELKDELAALVEEMLANSGSPIRTGAHSIVSHGNNNTNQIGSDNATSIGAIHVQGGPFGAGRA